MLINLLRIFIIVSIIFVNSYGYLESTTNTLNNTNSKTKTLATLGNGNIQIINQKDSDIKMLNTDIANNTIDIYNLSSHKGLKGELDTRLLTEDGRNQIKDDIVTASAITNAIEQIATTDKAGVVDFFKETDKNVKVYNGMKQELANNPELAQQLQDQNLDPSEKQEMLNTLATTVMNDLGYIPNKTKVISTDETGRDNEDVKGHFNNNTNYINDKNNKDTTDLVATTGHEITHAMDSQDDTFIAGDTDQNNYADNFGDDLSFYTDNALSQTYNTSLANTNNHIKPKSIEAHLELQRNNAEFAGLDKGSGDNMPLIIIPIVVGLIGAEQSLNAPEDDKKLTTPFEDASKIGRDYVRETVDSPKEVATGFDNGL